MSGFDNREKGFEAKFSHDEETKFRIRARRNKLLGQWVARAFGLSGDAAEAYAKDVVTADMDRPGDDDMIEKIMKDAAARRVQLDVHAVKRELRTLEETARADVLKGQK